MYYNHLIENDIKEIVDTIGNSLNKLSGQNILITGAGGMIASYLVYTLVYCNKNLFSNPCTIYCAVRNKINTESRLFQLTADANVKFVITNVADYYNYEVSMDYIIHAASKSSPKEYLHDPLGTMNVNTRGLQYLLEHARTNNTKSILFVSSGQIYGSPNKEFVPTPETYFGFVDCLGARACYDEAKRFGETLCKFYYEKHNVHTKIVRPFQIFGPGISRYDKRAFPDFIYHAGTNTPIIIKSKGLAKRSFCYLSDAVSAIFKVLLEGNCAEAYNIGQDEPLVTINELAEKVSNVVEPPLSIKYQISDKEKYLHNAPQITCPDIKKISNLLGEKPSISLEECIKRTYLWVKSQGEYNQ